ncbi:MAG: DUF748 domain-containing protein [Candidatus Omnitrophota bacterium]|jgi:hypothetical protein
MRLFFKILLTVFIVFLAVVVLYYLFLLSNAGKVITGVLRSCTGSEVTYRYYRVTPSLLVKMEEIKSGEASIQSLVCRINPAGILSGGVLIDRLELNGPEFYFHKEPGAYSALSAGKPSGSVPSLPGVRWLKHIVFTIKELSIKDGIVHFSDAPGGKALKLEVNKFFLNAVNVAFPPQDQNIVFKIEGEIPWGSSPDLGILEGRGRVNWVRKDINAELKVQDIDAVFFYPYYDNWVNLEKIRIEQARLAFSCELNGRDNKVAAKCRLELSDMHFKPYQEGEKPKMSDKLAHAVLDIFKGEDNKLKLDFTIHTTLDRPRFGLQNIKNAVEEKIERARPLDKFRPPDAVSLSRTIVQGTFKGVNDLSKAVVSGVSGIGKAFRTILNVCTKKE